MAILSIEKILLDNATSNVALINFPIGTSSVDGLNFGGDVNLYRSENNTLKTDDSLIISGIIYAGVSASALTDSNGKILTTAFDTIQAVKGGTGLTSYTVGD